jgi:hypothetical protein
MPGTKQVLFFLIKTILIFFVFVAPFRFYDIYYGKFYRSTCKILFSNFHDTGIAFFKETRNPGITQIKISNNATQQTNGMIVSGTSEFSTRYRGYIPTIFFISLLLASPLPLKRKCYSGMVGLILVTCIIMLQQWIQILFMCGQNKQLLIFNFTVSQKRMIDFFFFNFANYNGPSLVFMIAIWILVSFRKNDLESLFAV